MYYDLTKSTAFPGASGEEVYAGQGQVSALLPVVMVIHSFAG